MRNVVLIFAVVIALLAAGPAFAASREAGISADPDYAVDYVAATDSSVLVYCRYVHPADAESEGISMVPGAVVIQDDVKYNLMHSYNMPLDSAPVRNAPGSLKPARG